jgi:hypothetical protein
MAELDPEVAALLEKLKDRNWRLENLYIILDEGRAKPFIARPEQLSFRRNRHTRNMVPKARKLGISTEIVLENGDDCIFTPTFKAAIIDETEDAAWEKLEIFRFAWEQGPKHPNPKIAALWVLIQASNPLTANNNGEMAWSNGSSMQAGTSFTGRTPQRLHVSEFGPICDDSLEKGRKIMQGSINAVLPNDIVDIETTMRPGRIGPCWNVFNLSKKSVGRDMTSADWKLHFFPWFTHPSYILPGRAPTEDVTVKYFAELQRDYAITVPLDRQAWYEKKKVEQGDAMYQEYPSHVGECDRAAVIGMIYPQMSLVRTQSRVRDFNPEIHLPLYASFDCGGDSLSGWLSQPGRRDINLLDWQGTEGGGSAGLVAMVTKWEAQFGPISKIIMPHDADSNDKGSAKTFKAQVIECGIHHSRLIVVPRIPSVWTGIDWVRRAMPKLWFHSRCDKSVITPDAELPSAVVRMENYRRAVNKSTGALQDHPLKDGVCDHCADALRTLFEASEHGLVPNMPASVANVHPLDRDDEDDRPKRRGQAKFSFVGR